MAQLPGIVDHYDRAGNSECLAFSKTAELKLHEAKHVTNKDEFACRSLVIFFSGGEGVIVR